MSFTNHRLIRPQFSGDPQSDRDLMWAALLDFFRRLEMPDGVSSTATSGTWTPTLAGSTTAGTQTYSTHTGRYTKVGSLVILTDCVISLSALDGTTAGNAIIKGLPFAPVSGSNFVGGFAVGSYGGITLSAGYAQLGLMVNQPTTGIHLLQMGSGAGELQLPVSGLSNTTTIKFAGSYVAA